ncbi:hypothetical protein [Lysobacter sp. D1-1-M9]|uniref:hypothetical protein n=1 Tax=Novilysobacter longmucuonensis TaxID=3098603 RepID=UPI002FC5A4C9
MNSSGHEPGGRTPDDLPPPLNWQLRALRTDATPEHDLWDGIGARLPPRSPRSMLERSQRRRWPAPVALVATLLLALGFSGWWQRPPAPEPIAVDPSAAQPAPEQPAVEQATMAQTTPATAVEPTPVQREVDGMTRQYRAALVELEGAPTAPLLDATFEELDRNAGLILDALALDPNSRLLLGQLRRTYAHRLALSQRVVRT